MDEFSVDRLESFADRIPALLIRLLIVAMAVIVAREAIPILTAVWLSALKVGETEERAESRKDTMPPLMASARGLAERVSATLTAGEDGETADAFSGAEAGALTIAAGAISGAFGADVIALLAGVGTEDWGVAEVTETAGGAPKALALITDVSSARRLSSCAMRSLSSYRGCWRGLNVRCPLSAF